MTDNQIPVSCRCGQVQLRFTGLPMLRGICYCSDCQEAGRRHQAVPGADRITAEDGGTDYCLYRKDRVRCVAGSELFEERRLKPSSPMRRMFARCCNTALFADFTKGHWLSVYSGRLPATMPPATMRMMTAERPAGVVLPGDMANYPGRSGKFMLKLLGAWIAMGFRRPKVAGVP